MSAASPRSASLAEAKCSGSQSATPTSGPRDHAEGSRAKDDKERRHSMWAFPAWLVDKRNITGLPGGRALGLLVLLAMSICSIFLYAKMYSDLLPVHFDNRARAGHVATTAAVAFSSEPPRRLSLREAVENVASASQQRSIIFCSTSAAYLDFTENWYASVEKFKYGSRVLFIAEDVEALNYLSRKWPAQTVMVEPNELGFNDSLAEDERENSTYGSLHYNNLVDRRPEYFKALIDLNVSFLYNDVDIVWLKDPFPFFAGKFDMWVQEDAIELQLERFSDTMPSEPIKHKRHAVCTCFMFVHPTRASRRLVHRWSRHVHAKVQETGGAVLNQPAFNKALALTPPKDIKIGVLPVLSFPSGYIFFRCSGQPYCRKNKNERDMFWKEVKRRKQWPAMVHNNWLEGHDLKLARFKEYDLWLLPDNPLGQARRWRTEASDDV